MMDLSSSTTEIITSPVHDRQDAPFRDDSLCSSLLQLPRELIGRILLFVQTGDLLSLRGANRHLHHLIHDTERVIAQAHGERIRIKHNLSSVGVRLNRHRSNTHQSIPSTLTELFTFYREANSINLLSDITANHILQFCEPVTWQGFTPQQRQDHNNRESLREWRQTKAQQMSRELFQPYLILQTFLKQLARVAIDCEVHFADLDEQQYSCMTDVFDLDQQDIIHDMKLDYLQLVETTRALDIFYLVCAARGCHLLSCLGDKLAVSLKMVLMFHGLVPFRRILDADSQTEKKRLSNIESIKLMNGPLADQPKIHNSDQLIPTIFAIGPTECEHDRKFFCRRWSSVYTEFYDRQDLWTKAAMTRLARFVLLAQNSPLPVVTPTASKWIESVIADNSDANVASGVVVGPWWEFKVPPTE